MAGAMTNPLFSNLSLQKIIKQQARLYKNLKIFWGEKLLSKLYPLLHFTLTEIYVNY